MPESEREVRWEYLFPQEFKAAVVERPVCYMPLGTLSAMEPIFPSAKMG